MGVVVVVFGIQLDCLVCSVVIVFGFMSLIRMLWGVSLSVKVLMRFSSVVLDVV